MRARMALKMADIVVEIREISLRAKPRHLLEISPKGTVPVLVLPNVDATLQNLVIDASIDIMHWALQQNDAEGWLNIDLNLANQWLAENDGSFKQALDCYKYPERFPSKHIRRHHRGKR